MKGLLPMARHPARAIILPCVLTLLVGAVPLCADIEQVPLRNASFEEGVDAAGTPVGWALYASPERSDACYVRLVDDAFDGEHGLLLHDGDINEIGVTQTVSVTGGETYKVSVMVKPLPGQSTAGAHIQMRWLPTNTWAQQSINATDPSEFTEASCVGTAPEDATQLRIYIYTHKDPTPKFIIDDVKLLSGVPAPPPPPPPLPPPPDPVSEVYDTLKDLHLTTALVAGGQATITIVKPASGIYDAPAAEIAAAIRQIAGTDVPVVDDDATAAAIPINGNIITLGNRSTNVAIGRLYDLYYTLLDLKYPGPGGSVVRTLHNPFGDGHNIIFVGGSDTSGVEAAARVLIEKLNEAGGGQGELSVDRLMEIQLGRGLTPPTDVRDMETWEASRGYGSIGYFGWNSISKNMAMYYMTGREEHAREVVRLSFPDAQALKDIDEVDQERIEDKNDPLAGPYHYNAHMAILFWDLIEESPVFTDEERLRITNAFSRQLQHRKGEGVYTLRGPASAVGSRHGQWSAISLYCLGRYFNKYYPSPVWQHCVDSSVWHFASLHQYVWVIGEFDNLYWYSTGIAPIFTYLCLTGDRVPVEVGTVAELLTGQELLHNGFDNDRNINSASLGFLNKAAYITRDGRWLTYLKRTGMDTNIFRLGQSYWPEDDIEPALPTDLIDKWTIMGLSEPMWRARGSGIPIEQSFQVAGYRSTADASGDYILLDGYNGASRNPYHTFDVLDLRLNDHQLLSGYHNQVLPSADGMVEPQVAMDGALLHSDVIGATAVAIGEVPRAAYSNWRRSLAQRTGRYALIVDDLTFRTDSQNIELITEWEPVGGSWSADTNQLRINGRRQMRAPEGWLVFPALEADCSINPEGAGDMGRLAAIDTVLLRATQPGHWIEMPFSLKQDTAGEATVTLVGFTDRGQVRVLLDGRVVVEQFDHHAPTATELDVSLGRQELAAGDHLLRIEATAFTGNPRSCYIGLSSLSIKPDTAPEAEPRPLFALCPADTPDVTTGRAVEMAWRGPVNEGEHRIFFYALGQTMDAEAAPLQCARIASNAAAMTVPEPAIAVVGRYERMDAELGVLASDHIFGHGLTSAGAYEELFGADQPVDVDWDLMTGRLEVVAGQDTSIRLRLARATGLTINGNPSTTREQEGMVAVEIGAGRHVIEQASLDPTMLSGLDATLREQLAAGLQARAAAPAEQPRPQLAQLPTTMSTQIGGRTVDLITIPSAGGPLICAAEGRTVHVLDMAGNEVRRLETDGEVRVLRWWDTPRLLLVGCRDEKVIAFDEAGERKWVFTSVMDPAVYEAAKQYWFKSAPGHEGIHGLHTDVFIDGEEQAFVGSACTLEILDVNGQLVKRLPVFWGPGWKFMMVDWPDGTKRLCIARWPNGTNTLATIHPETFAVGRAFYGVPGDHTMVGGWTGLNITRMFNVDMNGNGTKEVVHATNGVWNRVTVFIDGTAAYNAQFGPGVSNQPYAQMRDMDVADLSGDGIKEIVVGINKGLIVTLNDRCERLWSTMMPSPPSVLKAFEATADIESAIIVGCVDGTVILTDAGGAMTREASVGGRPWHIVTVETDAGPVVVMGTDRGEIAGFPVN